MRIEDVPFMTTDWRTLPASTHPGTSGVALWRTVEQGNIRVRMVAHRSRTSTGAKLFIVD
jgi:hypothetical protein